MGHFCRSACCNTLLCRVHMRQRRKTCDPWHVHGMYLPWTESLRSLAFSQGIPPKDGTVVLWRSCHIQTLQLFPLTNPTVVPAQLRPPCECLECRILDKTLLFCTGALGESPSPPESAWIAEYSIKHAYSAQDRSESRPAPLRVRGLQHNRQNTIILHRPERGITQPP